MRENIRWQEKLADEEMEVWGTTLTIIYILRHGIHDQYDFPVIAVGMEKKGICLRIYHL